MPHWLIILAAWVGGWAAFSVLAATGWCLIRRHHANRSAGEGN